jgi:hypothetical protein
MLWQLIFLPLFPTTSATTALPAPGDTKRGIARQLEDGAPAEARALRGHDEVRQGDAGALQRGGRVQGHERGRLGHLGGELGGQQGELGLGEFGDVEGHGLSFLFFSFVCLFYSISSLGCFSLTSWLMVILNLDWL